MKNLKCVLELSLVPCPLYSGNKVENAGNQTSYFIVRYGCVNSVKGAQTHDLHGTDIRNHLHITTLAV